MNTFAPILSTPITNLNATAVIFLKTRTIMCLEVIQNLVDALGHCTFIKHTAAVNQQYTTDGGGYCLAAIGQST